MSRTDELTARLLDGILTDSEWDELERLFATDPVAADDHVALLELEGVLRGLLTDFDLSESTLARLRDTRAERTTRAVMAQIASRDAPTWLARPQPADTPAPRSVGRHRPWLPTAAAVAIAIGLLVGIWLRSATWPTPNRDEPPPPVQECARVTQTVGTVELLTPQGEVLTAREGGEVPPGHTLRTVGDESLVRVQLAEQTLLDIEADTVVRFEVGDGAPTGQPRLFLAAGQLTAAISDQASPRPLVVSTGVADILGKSGEFVVSSASPESARVDIKRGNVEVVRRDLPRPMPMHSGSAFLHSDLAKVLFEPGPPVDRTPARTLVFPGAREAVFSPDGGEVWIASSRQLARWTNDGGTNHWILSSRRNEGVVVFTPDRTVLGTHSGNKDDLLTLWALPHGEKRASLDLRLPPEARFRTLAPDAAWLALAGYHPGHRKRLVVYDGKTGAERFARECEESIGCVAASPDGRWRSAFRTWAGVCITKFCS